MASLTGTKIKDTYDSLLKVSDNGALDGTLQVISDGLGNNSALSLSTAGASVGGTLAVSGAATVGTTLGVTGAGTFSTNVELLNGSLIVNNGAGTAYSSRLSTSVGFPFVNTLIDSYGGASYEGQILFRTSSNAGAQTERMKIHYTGDISFRDSSANEAFYWDASAASLGIGTNFIQQSGANRGVLTVNGATSAIVNFAASNVLTSYIYADAGGGTYETIGSSVISATGANHIAFNTNGTERMRILSSGGLTFNGDTSSANALDDYEEGTWTPSLNSGTFDTVTATYTKVGRLVTINLDFQVGTGGGHTITGLPYTCLTTTAVGIYTSLQDFSAGYSQMTAVLASNTLYLRQCGDNVVFSSMPLTASATVHMTATYFTS